MKNKLLYQLTSILKSIHEAREIKESEEKLKKNREKIGIEYFDVNGKNIKVYLTKNKVIVYANNDISIDEEQNLKIEIYNYYGRPASIKKTVNGFIIPEGFVFDKKGITAIVEKEKKGETVTEYKLISDRWLFVTSQVYSEYHDIYQYEVESVHPIKNKSISALCNMDTLGRCITCISFCMTNLAISTSELHKKELVDFFNKFVIENKNNMKQKRTLPHMGWNETFTEFFPYSKNLYFDYTGDSSNYMYNTIKSFTAPKLKNQEDEAKRVLLYKKKLQEYCKSSDLNLVVNTFLAAPLISLLNVRSFTVNFHGKTMSMKSFAGSVGMSIFAKPKVIKATGEDTKLVTMAKLAMFHNLPFYIDEIRQGNNPLNIYAIGNGIDRHRMSKDSFVKESKTFHTIAIATSEAEIYEDSNKGGELNRLLCIPINCASQLGLDNESNLKEFARENYKFVENNYALLGEIYIKYLIENKVKIEEIFKKIMGNIKNEKKPTEYAYMMAAIYTADYIKNNLFFGIDNIEESIKQGNLYLNKCENKENLDESTKMIDYIYQFYEINRGSFQSPGSPIKTNQYFGEVKDNKIYFIVGPLKEYMTKNAFTWSNKKMLIDKNLIEYKNIFINKKAQKRIILDLDVLNNYETLERESIENEEIENNVVNFPGNN